MPITSAPASSIEVFRHFYARFITAKNGIENERIKEAFSIVEREHFAGPGPWQIALPLAYISTESTDPRLLYQDILIGLKTEKNINNGEPSLHAKCLDRVAPQSGEIVIHIGAGTGYYTAILAQLLGENGLVHAYELDTDIAQRAISNLASVRNVRVYSQSALTSLPKADIIYVCAAATHPPEQWLDALNIGGRLLMPLVPNERHGCMILITRLSHLNYKACIFMEASFIPCIGARDEQASRVLADALNAGGQDNVKSLRRNKAPDQSAWCIGDNWWLSSTGIN